MTLTIKYPDFPREAALLEDSWIEANDTGVALTNPTNGDMLKIAKFAQDFWEKLN
ncbi:MAG: hypothetical protein HN582_12600 [Marinovum sp.]|jgi:hypothetical protein|nr:hypothetical protein [Marinovum sp.]